LQSQWKKTERKAGEKGAFISSVCLLSAGLMIMSAADDKTTVLFDFEFDFEFWSPRGLRLRLRLRRLIVNKQLVNDVCIRL
jgi:hypothetical protein